MSEKKIGRYEIKEELGRGGMATVYLAYDPVLERNVALKLLPNYFAHDPEFSARFEREAKTVAALEHGSIVSMYDYGEDGEWPYFVMRLMKGGSLKDRLGDGPLSLEKTAKIIQRVAGALDKAHSKDIVHRDLKPGNIMFDEDGAAYLADFGIVKLAESSESYTRTGNTLGTAAYMSPEQADGRPDIDGRSDVYALGIILYEMLVGKAPYVHDSTARLLVMQLTEPIPDIRAARPEIPPAVQSIIEKAMAKNREERYDTAGEMAEALQAVVEGRHTAVPTAEPPTVEETPAAAATPKPEPAEAPPTRSGKGNVAGTAVSSPASQPVQPIPAPAAAAAPATAPAKKGAPTWVYAVVGVVIVAILGVALLALGGGDDPAVSDDTTFVDEEAAVEAAAVAEEPEAVAEDTGQQVDESSSVFDPQFNYFDDPDNWDFSFPEGVDLFIEDGQAIFWSQLNGSVWANYLGTFADGTYEVEMTALAAQAGAVGFGMLIMYDEDTASWYEFTLDTNGDGAVFYCEEGCDAVDEPFFDGWTEFDAINTGEGATNIIQVEANQGELAFFVNDEEFGSVFDNRRTSGNIGLILYNDSEQDLEVMFDNFTYTPAP